MAKKTKGHVMTFSITGTEAYIFRGYTEDAQSSPLVSEDDSIPEIIENIGDNKPKIEPESTKSQIIKPSVASIYKYGNMQI